MADVPQIYQTKLQRAQKAYRGGNYPLSLALASSFFEDQVYRAQSGTTFDLFEFKVRSLAAKCKFALKLPAEVVLDGQCLLETPQGRGHPQLTFMVVLCYLVIDYASMERTHPFKDHATLQDHCRALLLPLAERDSSYFQV
jgi:hypothetical protein